jgi:hypothetical protein
MADHTTWNRKYKKLQGIKPRPAPSAQFLGHPARPILSNRMDSAIAECQIEHRDEFPTLPGSVRKGVVFWRVSQTTGSPGELTFKSPVFVNPARVGVVDNAGLPVTINPFTLSSPSRVLRR